MPFETIEIKNKWLIGIIKELECSEFYGKLTLNFCKGDIPKIRQEKDILKPNNGKGENDGDLESDKRL